jgi:hypothetical protein
MPTLGALANEREPMELSIIFKGPLEHCSRFDVEEALEDWLDDKGEVVGGGAATDGSWGHIDVDIESLTKRNMKGIVQKVRAILKKLKAPSTARIVIVDDENTKVGEFDL